MPDQFSRFRVSLQRLLLPISAVSLHSPDRESLEVSRNLDYGCGGHRGRLSVSHQPVKMEMPVRRTVPQPMINRPERPSVAG